MLCEGYIDEIRIHLEEKLAELGIELPPDVSLAALTTAFLDYLEIDAWDWISENSDSFFSRIHDEGWEWVRKRA